MTFFVPGGGTEDTYLALAEFGGAAPAEPGQRVKSITYVSEKPDEVWTAEVGEPLAGKRSVGARDTKLTDTAVVQAIYPREHDFVVVTDARPLGTLHSSWDNPFWVRRDEIDEIELFD